MNNSISRDGFTLHYSIEGNGIPTIVIGSHLYYPRTFSHELRQHLQLIFIDQRAFCLNSNASIEDFALDKLLDDIEALRTQLQLQEIILIGHSIHALIATEYAKKYPDAVKHLILIAASPIAGSTLIAKANQYFAESVCPARKTLLRSNLAAYSEQSEQTFVTRMLSFAPMIWYDLNYDASALWQNVELHPIGATYIWGPLFERYQFTQDLNRVTCPIFIALGRYDYWNPPHLWEAIRDQWSAITLRVFEKSGHTPQLEEGVEFNRELLSALDAAGNRAK